MGENSADGILVLIDPADDSYFEANGCRFYHFDRNRQLRGYVMKKGEADPETGIFHLFEPVDMADQADSLFCRFHNAVSGAWKKYYAVRLGYKPGIFHEWFGEDEAEKQIKGYGGAKYQKFSTWSAAYEFITGKAFKEAENSSAYISAPGAIKESVARAEHAAQGHTEPPATDESTEDNLWDALVSGGRPGNPADTRISKQTSLDDLREPYAYVDGTYNAEQNAFGYGGLLVANGRKHTLQGAMANAEYAVHHNISGELMGTVAAIKKAQELGLHELSICHDYLGIYRWPADKNTDPEAWNATKKLTRAYRQFVRSCGLKLTFIHTPGHTGIPGNEEADRLAKESILNLCHFNN